METGWESWERSAWTREGGVETSQLLPVSERATGKLEKENSPATAVTGQGEWAQTERGEV